MFRLRQPLRRYCGGALSHTELQVGKNGKVIPVLVDDCKPLDPISDFDLETNLRAGENLREMSAVIRGGNVVKDDDFVNTETEKEEKQDEE